jgi:hypothetical protein
VVFRRLSKALKSSASSNSSFIAVHDTQLDEPPKDLLEGAAGLAAVQPVRRQDGKLSFIAYWSSPADATLAGRVLENRLGAPSGLSGIAGEPLAKPPPDLWGRAKDKAVPLLLTTVAVVAALEGLSNRYVALIAAPQFTVRFDAPAYNADQGESIPASLTMENALTAVELTDINVDPKLNTSLGALSGSVEMLKLQDVSLPATKSRTYYMSLDNLAPGDHVVSARVTAKAGYFRKPVPSSAIARVLVWPSSPQASISLKQTRHDRADFRFMLRVGKAAAPSTVVCDLRFAGDFKVSNNYWRPLGKADAPQWLTADGIALLQVGWREVGPRSSHYAEFSLVGEANTDWKKVAANVEPMCSIT